MCLPINSSVSRYISFREVCIAIRIVSWGTRIVPALVLSCFITTGLRIKQTDWLILSLHSGSTSLYAWFWVWWWTEVSVSSDMSEWGTLIRDATFLNQSRTICWFVRIYPYIVYQIKGIEESITLEHLLSKSGDYIIQDGRWKVKWSFFY